MKHLERLFPICIALAGIVVAQIHGGPFWVGVMGSVWIGWCVSGIWEAASVWLWWRGDRSVMYQAAKFAATAALLAGMVAQSSGPLLARLDAAESAQVGVVWEKEITSRLLDAAIDQERRGWKDSIDSSIGKIRELSKIATLSPEHGFAVFVPLVAFPSLYGLALLALVTLARDSSRNPKKPPENVDGIPKIGKYVTSQESPGTGFGAPRKLSRIDLAKAYRDRHGLTTQGSVAKALGEHGSTFNEFLKDKSGPEVNARIEGKLNGS